MGFIKEFKEFALKGNLLDLAVAVIIGTAFGKIVASFVADIIMPPLGLMLSGGNYRDYKVTLKKAITTGNDVQEAVTINLGNFMGTTIDFLIIAFTVFLVIKGLNSLKKKEAAVPPAPAPPAPLTSTDKLLMEIRDALKNK